MRHAFVSLLLLVSTSAHADIDWRRVNPGRRSFFSDAEPTATGTFEVEAGIAASDRFASGTAQWILKYGLSEDVDVRVNVEHTVWGADFDLAGTSLLIKYSLRHPDDGVLGVAVEPYLTVPSLSGGPEGFGGGALFIATYLTHDFQIDANAIFDVTTAHMADTAVTLTPVVAISHDIADGLTGYVEPGIDLGLAGGGGTNAFVGLGLDHDLTQSLTVDAVVYVGAEPRTEVFVGLTYSVDPARSTSDP